MPRIRNPEDVNFLTFEGGGGKGVTYVGALRALEKLALLPIPYITDGPRDDAQYEFSLVNTTPKFVPDRSSIRKANSQIRGISGASAGAFTALVLTLGHSSLSIWSLLKRKSDFEALYDAPEPGLLRGVVRNRGGRVLNRNLGATSAQEREAVVRRRFGEIPVLQGHIPFKLFISLAKDRVHFVQKMAQREDLLGWYLYNIFYDRGFFPGFALRKYIYSLVLDFYIRLPFVTELSYGEISRRAWELSFAQLKELTDIDFVVTGTNLTARSVEYFSSSTTPDFPVIDAVALSMTFPIFKPVWIEDTKDVGSGYWVDGGFLNNLPIHAFDGRAGRPLRRDTLAGRPLNPHTLALRLGARRDSDEALRAYDPGKLGIKVKPADELMMHIADLEETLLYPSEGGQLRTSAEAEQTIDLATFDLETTEFSPGKKKAERPVREAYKSVMRYFGQ